MRVILADPQILVRAGMRRLIEALPGAVCAGETGDGQQLLEMVARQRPDIVVTEVTLANVNGFDAVTQIRRHFPEVGVLILSAQTAAQTVRAALKAGAFGFLAKDAEPVELELALRATCRGQSYFSPAVSRNALEQRRLQRAENRPRLTPRQRQVMELLARGRSTKEIAGIMGVSIKTVETHRARVMQLLHLGSANALIHYAIRNGFDSIS